jgi:hypothetical protein
LRSGANCLWTTAAGLANLHCHKNARLFRVTALKKSASPLAPNFEVFRVKSFEDKRGVAVRRYRTPLNRLQSGRLRLHDFANVISKRLHRSSTLRPILMTIINLCNARNCP